MPSKKTKDSGDQSARFIEAAKSIGADETGKKFERAFKKVLRSIRPKAKAKTP